MLEIGSAAGAKWKELDPNEKAPYQQMAEADKERAKKELLAYQAKRSQAAPESSEAAEPPKAKAQAVGKTKKQLRNEARTKWDEMGAPERAEYEATRHGLSHFDFLIRMPLLKATSKRLKEEEDEVIPASRCSAVLPCSG